MQYGHCYTLKTEVLKITLEASILTLLKSAGSVTQTPHAWGVSIVTLRKCYLDATITSVALTLRECCFDTLITPYTCRNGHFRGLVWHIKWILSTLCEFRVTHRKGSFNTMWVQSNTSQGFFQHSVSSNSVVFTALCGLSVTINWRGFLRVSHNIVWLDGVFVVSL